MTSIQQALLIAVVTTAPALGDHRYLSDVQASLGFDDAAFRKVVFSAWYDGLVQLSRADLVRDVVKETASEMRLETETFHYIELAA